MGFKYATHINLNRGYLSIPLDKKTRNILNIVMPFRFFECQVLPMGINSASDLFQARTVGLFQGMGETKPSPFIDDIIHTKGDRYESHLDICDKILTCLEVGGMQSSVNSFGAMVPYMGPIFVIRYAMRRRKTFHLTKSHDLYTVGKPKARAIFLGFKLR